MVPVVYGLLLLSGPPAIAQEAVHKDVPYVPTPPAVVETMLKLGELQKGLGHGGIALPSVVIESPRSIPQERGGELRPTTPRRRHTHRPLRSGKC